MKVADLGGVLFVDKFGGDDFALLVLVFLDMQNAVFFRFPDDTVERSDVVINADNKGYGAGKKSLVVLDDVVTTTPSNLRPCCDVALPDGVFRTEFILVDVGAFNDDRVFQKSCSHSYIALSGDVIVAV